MNRTLPAPASDIALVVTRALIATIMFAHGFQKMFIQGIGQTSDGFEALSIPLAIVSASFVTLVEVVGSVLLLAGAMTTIVCGLNLVIMGGAAIFVHIPNGIFVADGGWEFVGALGAGFIALAAMGPGRFSVDHVIRRYQRKYRDDLRSAETGPQSVVGTHDTFTPANGAHVLGDVRPAHAPIDVRPEPARRPAVPQRPVHPEPRFTEAPYGEVPQHAGDVPVRTRLTRLPQLPRRTPAQQQSGADEVRAGTSASREPGD